MLRATFRLVWKRPRQLKIDRIRQQGTPETILAPIAEAAAVLLATTDFSLVKRCEDQTCVLWFSDQTTSHRRGVAWPFVETAIRLQPTGIVAVIRVFDGLDGMTSKVCRPVPFQICLSYLL